VIDFTGPLLFTRALDSRARLDRARWLAARLKLEALDEDALARIPELK